MASERSVAATPAVSTGVLLGITALTIYNMFEGGKALRDLAMIGRGECAPVDKGPLEDILGTFFGKTAGNIGHRIDQAGTLASLALAGKGVKEGLREAAERGGALGVDKALPAGSGGLSAIGTLLAW